MTKQIENLLDLKYMKPLLLLGNIVGQFQPNDMHQNYKPILWYKCYAGVVSLAILGAYAEMQYEENFRGGIFKNTTAVVMNFMSVTIFTVASVYAILENVFLGPSKLHASFQKFLRIDKLLTQIENSKIVEHRDFSIKIIVQHGFIFTIMAFNIVWFEVFGGKRTMKITYLQFFEQYASFIAFLIITNCFIELRNRYKSMNLSLVAIFDEAEIEKPNVTRVSKYIETLTMIYGTLTEIVDLFNDLFGWQILVMFIYTLVGLLASLNIIALFIPKYSEITDHYQINGGYFIAVVLDFTLFSIVNNYILAKLADSIYEEAKQTSLICYKILQKTRAKFFTNEEQQIRENLSFLAQEASLRATKISAAGFFEVDYTMVFLLFTSVTTYIVVLIQFNM